MQKYGVIHLTSPPQVQRENVFPLCCKVGCKYQQECELILTLVASWMRCNTFFLFHIENAPTMASLFKNVYSLDCNAIVDMKVTKFGVTLLNGVWFTHKEFALALVSKNYVVEDVVKTHQGDVIKEYKRGLHVPTYMLR